MPGGCLLTFHRNRLRVAAAVVLTILAADQLWAARAPKPDKALVYLIRVRRFAGSARSVFVFADRNLLTVLPNDTYAVGDVKPGKRLLWTTFTNATREVELVPGETYYFEVWSQITAVGPAQGEALVREARTGALPTAEEQAKGEKYIRKKYEDAIASEKRREKAPLPAVADSAPVPPGQEGMVRIPAYTRGELEFMETVTSEFSPMGTPVLFRLVADVVVDGRVVAPAGTIVTGLVRESTQAGANGKPGVLEVSAPGLKAVDGCQVPLIAQLAASGPEDDRAASAGAVAGAVGGTAAGSAAAGGAAVAAGAAAGAAGGAVLGGLVGLAIRGREAYYLAGERLRVWTREDAWLRDRTAITDSAEPSTAGAATSGLTLDARCAEPVRFTPPKGYRPSDIKIDLESASRPVTVAVTSVAGFVLPDPLKAKECLRHDDGWRCTFDGWGLTRYLRVGHDAAEQTVMLTGQLEGDGGAFTATVGIEYQVER